MSDDVYKKINNTKELLNSVSSSMCLAKWSQVTLHLQNGQTHSCHHPVTHKIPIEEIQKDPSALHNTSYKKQRRQEMLRGIRPKECDYCWNIEDTGNTSDRVYKSSCEWSLDMKDKIMEAGATENVNPGYLEVSFSNVCNFKCGYCAPHISSKWMEEIKQHGPYPTSENYNNLDWIKKEGKMPIPHNQPNPYVKAFWDWWPDMIGDLKVFRITGGEPLLSKDTWKVLDYFEENAHPELELGINSNLGVPDKLIQQFIEKLYKIRKNLKYIWIYTSVDTSGSNAEYIRHGLDYNKFMDNLNKLLVVTTNTNILVSYMCTLNLFSPPNFLDLLKEVRQQKIYAHPTQLIFDTPYLREPKHLSLELLTEDFYPYFDECLEYMQEHERKDGKGEFLTSEIEKFNRVVQWMKKDRDEATLKQPRIDFYKFIDEHDKRRGTDFFTACPEFIEFYNYCRSLDETNRS